jgi:hypothetical protein
VIRVYHGYYLDPMTPYDQDDPRYVWEGKFVPVAEYAGEDLEEAWLRTQHVGSRTWTQDPPQGITVLEPRARSSTSGDVLYRDTDETWHLAQRFGWTKIGAPALGQLATLDDARAFAGRP